MTIDGVLKKINDRLGDRLLKVDKKGSRRAYIDIYPKDIVDITHYLFKELGFRFSIASGVDDFDGIEILYHFSYDPSGVIVTPKSSRISLSIHHAERVTVVMVSIRGLSLSLSMARTVTITPEGS